MQKSDKQLEWQQQITARYTRDTGQSSVFKKRGVTYRTSDPTDAPGKHRVTIRIYIHTMKEIGWKAGDRVMIVGAGEHPSNIIGLMRDDDGYKLCPQPIDADETYSDSLGKTRTVFFHTHVSDEVFKNLINTHGDTLQDSSPTYYQYDDVLAFEIKT